MKFIVKIFPSCAGNDQYSRLRAKSNSAKSSCSENKPKMYARASFIIGDDDDSVFDELSDDLPPSYVQLQQK